MRCCPAITVIGLEFAFLIGGLVVTEQVFNLNGIGQLFVQSVSRNDFTLIQGMVMLIAAFYVFVNLVDRPALRGVRSRASGTVTDDRSPPMPTLAVRCRKRREPGVAISPASSRSARSGFLVILMMMFAGIFAQCGRAL